MRYRKLSVETSLKHTFSPVFALLLACAILLVFVLHKRRVSIFAHRRGGASAHRRLEDDDEGVVAVETNVSELSAPDREDSSLSSAETGSKNSESE